MWSFVSPIPLPICEWAAIRVVPFAGSSMLGGYKNEVLEAAVDEALTLASDDPRRCELALEAQGVVAAL